MPAQQENRSNGEKGKGALLTCYVLFALYFINVIFGKVNISYDLNIPHLGNVAEFLLLLLASVSLVAAALKSEAAENNLQLRQKERKNDT
jgi:heme A synthase